MDVIIDYMSKSLSDKDIEYILSIKHSDITKELMKNLFASTESHKAKFDPTDTFILPAKKYYNDKAESTTVGRYITNLFLFDGKIIENIGYQNIVMGKKNIGAMDAKCTQLIFSNKISIQDFYDYIDRVTWLGYACNNFLVASLNTDIQIATPEIKKLKEKLIEENKEELEKDNPYVTNKIEKELLDKSRELYKDNPAMEIYDSGCRGDFNNNFKNTVLMRGSIMDFADPSHLMTSTASLEEGIPKRDFSKYANIMTAASYSRSMATQRGGYLVKQYNSAYQTLQIGEPGSDCGTDKYIQVKITGFNKSLFRFRYIIENKKLKLLNDEDLNSYVGKTVNMRSPMYCKNPAICSKCMGELYYYNNMYNIGLLANRQGSTIMQLSMKMFHNSTVKTTEFDPEEYISIVE
jgi:hypothetical protein